MTVPVAVSASACPVTSPVVDASTAVTCVWVRKQLWGQWATGYWGGEKCHGDGDS